VTVLGLSKNANKHRKNGYLRAVHLKKVTDGDGLFNITYIENSIYRVIYKKPSPSVTHERNLGKTYISHFANRHQLGKTYISHFANRHQLGKT